MGRTAARLISSGYFTYKVDLTKMIQQNTRTKKVRTIRRAIGAQINEAFDPKSRRPGAPAITGMKRSRKLPMKKMMKAMKSMKAMKAKKKSKVGKKHLVFNGKKDKTSGGMKKADLVKNKFGKIVSKR